MLCFPEFSLSQMRFPCGAPGGHGERSMSVKKALHENAVFTSPACGSNWRPIWLSLVGFLGDYVGKNVERHQSETWLPLLIFDKPESSEAWQLAPRDMEEGTTRSFRFSSCLPDIYSNDFFFLLFALLLTRNITYNEDSRVLFNLTSFRKFQGQEMRPFCHYKASLTPHKKQHAVEKYSLPPSHSPSYTWDLGQLLLSGVLSWPPYVHVTWL